MKPALILPVLVLALVANGAAVAQETQAVPESQASPTLEPLALTPTMKEALAQGLAPDTSAELAAWMDGQNELIGISIDAAIAQNITALGAFTTVGPQYSTSEQASHGRRQMANGISRTTGRPYADPGLNIDQLGRQQFGSPKLLAVGVEQRFADSRHLATQIGLRHASGPVDLRLNLNGNKPLASQAQMNLSYDSVATFQLNPELTLGVKARGWLGSLDNFAPATTHDAGAFARLRLAGKGGLLSAETGYDTKLGPGGVNAPGQFRANLNLNLKL